MEDAGRIRNITWIDATSGVLTAVNDSLFAGSPSAIFD
jgi:hypothetical protein